MRTETVNTECRIFGGLPIMAEATVSEDEYSSGVYIDRPTLYWLNGREFTQKLYNKLKQQDWDEVNDALASSFCNY